MEKMSLAFSQLLVFLGLGFLIGIEHAFDSDHVAAVASILSHSKNIKRAALTGAFWGLGHTATLASGGVLLLLFKVAIPLQLALSFELIIGLLLIILGLDILRKMIWRKDETALRPMQTYRKSLIIGMLHGLAGSAGLMLLVLPAVSSAFQGMLFIMAFGLGSIASMTLLTLFIGVSLNSAARYAEPFKIITASLTTLLGMVMVYNAGLLL